MKDKMISFLKTIHIENIDDFDIDFEMVGRDRFNHDQIDMIIIKENPWNYRLLRQFLDGLETIHSYSYLIRFSYRNKPTFEDIQNLLNDWYQNLYLIPCRLHIVSNEDDVLTFLYQDEEEQNVYSSAVEDFKSLLKFITYDWVIKEEIKPEVKEAIPSKEKADSFSQLEIKKEENSISNGNKEEVITDKQEVKDLIEKEKQEHIKSAEDILLEEIKTNTEIMKKERERARINKRGNYVFYEMIDAIDSNSLNVDFDGEVFSFETIDSRRGKRYTIGVNDDFGGAIYVSAFPNNQINDDLVAQISKKGTHVRIRGAAYVDDWTKMLTIKAHFIDLVEGKVIEKEEYEKNRVELHLHSSMSTQDGVNSMMDYANYAKKLGHTAMAITDHGCVQGFPDAQAAGIATGLKMLYGCEFYMVDDQLTYIKNPSKEILNKATFVVLDLETTGLSARYCKIIEFGAVKIEKGTEIDRLDILINPGVPIPKKISEITNITDDMLKGQPTIDVAMDKIVEFCKGAILVTHNADFDFSFMQQALIDLGRPILTNPVIDTLQISRYLFPQARAHRLGNLCRNMDIKYDEDSAHRADYDAWVLNEVWQPILATLTKNNLNMTHEDLGKLDTPKNLLPHMRPLHIVALAKNKAGLKELYKLVSISNIDYLAEVPKLPRSILQSHRENLLIGSACFNGEVFRTAQYYNEERLREAIRFYDYIEVQDPENYSFLVNMGDIEQEDVYQYIKDIISASEKENKMVVATGDVHYLSKKEKIFRDVLIATEGIGHKPHALNPFSRSKKPRFDNPDQHYRTTKEMLTDFAFLGEEKAKEIVITNTNIIADQIESFLPVPNDHLYTPKIEHCEENLRQMCYDNAAATYSKTGKYEDVDPFIKTRLETELDGIINHGYSVIYWIAHKLVKKANDDGYMVGSRGSVGSSFVATMCGVTEVNALPPHYICPNCHHLEWTKESLPQYKSGYDLPNKKCPECGEQMDHDGQDIPFQTFLGFKADKTPDIDLNFPGDYQARAHDYTKVLLGESNVFRAGTIETVAEKTAYQYAYKYIRGLGIDPDDYPRAKIAYLASGCVGIKRTTGQHPGGIVVVPSEYEVYDFTPVQWPAEDVNSSWKTTHFDFHSIHDTILKLDLLGHVDPMALKMMGDLTGININKIPMNDQKVLSIFSSPDALKMDGNFLNQKTGAMGIPEFGTEFVRGMLEKTSPKTFNDLVILSGLSHGTDVWNGNAETLIDEKIASLQEVIGCRDDIMTYLIAKGLPPDKSFKIMEDVRKGKGLKEEYVELMKANNVPQYYMDSCNKIKYMFPKGHAVAYVTQAIRVGYFKIYYPLEYYATFLTVRSKQYDIKAMIKGKDAIIARLLELKEKQASKTEKLTPKEEEQIKTLNICVEMVQRGYQFENIDLYKSDAVKFVVDHEHNALIPPFITIDGLGENNAVTVIEARANGKFLSKEDLANRTKLTLANIDELSELGALDGLDETNQMSLFDF